MRSVPLSPAALHAFIREGLTSSTELGRRLASLDDAMAESSFPTVDFEDARWNDPTRWAAGLPLSPPSSRPLTPPWPPTGQGARHDEPSTLERLPRRRPSARGAQRAARIAAENAPAGDVDPMLTIPWRDPGEPISEAVLARRRADGDERDRRRLRYQD